MAVHTSHPCQHKGNAAGRRQNRLAKWEFKSACKPLMQHCQ
jgi:hypothetical protein